MPDWSQIFCIFEYANRKPPWPESRSNISLSVNARRSMMQLNRPKRVGAIISACFARQMSWQLKQKMRLVEHRIAQVGSRHALVVDVNNIIECYKTRPAPPEIEIQTERFCEVCTCIRRLCRSGARSIRNLMKSIWNTIGGMPRTFEIGKQQLALERTSASVSVYVFADLQTWKSGIHFCSTIVWTCMHDRGNSSVCASIVGNGRAYVFCVSSVCLHENALFSRSITIYAIKRYVSDALCSRVAPACSCECTANKHMSACLQLVTVIPAHVTPIKRHSSIYCWKRELSIRFTRMCRLWRRAPPSCDQTYPYKMVSSALSFD